MTSVTFRVRKDLADEEGVEVGDEPGVEAIDDDALVGADVKLIRQEAPRHEAHCSLALPTVYDVLPDELIAAARRHKRH